MASSPRDGFTLVELLAVLVLLAVFAAATALSVRGNAANASLETFLDRLETFDGRVGADARRQNQAQLNSFDANDARIYQRNQFASTPARRFAVPWGVTLEQIKTQRQQSDQGVLQVAVSARGQTDTYALQLRASSGRSVWLVVLGASGQCLRLDRESDVDEIFSLQLAADRRHTG